MLPVEIFAMSLGAFAGIGKAGIGNRVRNWQWVKESGRHRLKGRISLPKRSGAPLVFDNPFIIRLI
jgi:hypothetical protein